ncbi:MAG TPA: carbohydrate ABC transporter permease [Candidatus Atribacteria bacterium]|nr:carbohydrate ABC transporter permease [Candidatus Atribacteria bacterium]
MSHSRRKFKISFVKQIIACILSLMVILPFVMVFLNSFKSESEAAFMNLSLPKSFKWENYLIAIERGKLITSFFNSMIYSIAATFISTIVNSMAAFVLSREKSKLNHFLYFFIVLGLVLPTNYIALIKVMQALHLLNTRLGVILFYAAMHVPFGTFILYGFVGTIPRELDEAALIDGANAWNLFFKIVFPLLRPAVVTVALLTFLGVWNDFMTPLYLLNRASQWPMTLAVYNFFGQYQAEWNLIFADVVLTCLPVFIVYLFGQKHVVSGMTTGAIKG